MSSIKGMASETFVSPSQKLPVQPYYFLSGIDHTQMSIDTRELLSLKSLRRLNTVVQLLDFEPHSWPARIRVHIKQQRLIGSPIVKVLVRGTTSQRQEHHAQTTTCLFTVNSFLNQFNLTTPVSRSLTKLLTTSVIAKFSTLPFKVASYPAVPPNPTTSRLLRAYPSALGGIHDGGSLDIYDIQNNLRISNLFLPRPKIPNSCLSPTSLRPNSVTLPATTKRAPDQFWFTLPTPPALQILHVFPCPPG